MAFRSSGLPPMPRYTVTAGPFISNEIQRRDGFFCQRIIPVNIGKVFPANKLPDLRGEFIIIWDDGRRD